jgi:predicted AlkP superfamily phosphohydrolase/phosphomutase
VKTLLLAMAIVAVFGDLNPAWGYIGPGAGIALLGSFMTIFLALASAILAMFTWPLRWLWRTIRGQKAYKHAKVKRVVLIGLDGLEPTLAEQFMADGDMPNLSKLRDEGMYTRMGTTFPPLSPVAWSSFSTGVNPGKHNIFDFLNRNPFSYMPTLSSVRIGSPKRTLKIGSYVIPLSKPELTGLRKSKTFWSILGEHGIMSCIQRVPITFPPEKFKGVQLSAMCVPDLLGTQGTFSFYSTRGGKQDEGEFDVGGEQFIFDRNNGHVESYFKGPENSIKPSEKFMKVPFKILANGSKTQAVLKMPDQDVTLKVGEYSEWTDINFKAGLGIKARGIARLYLKSVEPEVELYCTPIQIDPDKPVMPVSHPAVYSSYLARMFGKFSTLGLAEDTWCLNAGVMSEEAYLDQCYKIHAEREKMFFDGLERVKRGFLCCVFDGPDRIQHMFFRFLDKNHPAIRGKDELYEQNKNVIREMYKRMDDLVGRTREKLAKDANTALFVMSDHGFKQFQRGIDLNCWLAENGYLKAVAGKAEEPWLAGVDWAGTRAYTVGLCGIFINQKGRESKGIVEPGGAYESLVNEIAEKLTGLKDPETGETAILKAYPRGQVYKGPYTQHAPDIIIGYNEKYRVHWDAATGKTTGSVFHDNVKAWSGDHCIDPNIVPGVLFSNRKFETDGPNIVDMAPTILDLFGIEAPKFIDGKKMAWV